MDITRIIKGNGLKVTPQRRAVYKAMQELRHATADQIIEKVRERNPTVTVSTVYRVLDSFCKARLLSSVGNPGDGKYYYDITAEDHHHLFSGTQITDYDDPELTELIRRYLKSKLPDETTVGQIQVNIIVTPKKLNDYGKQENDDGFRPAGNR